MLPTHTLHEFFHQLGQRVQGEIRTDTHSKLLYSTDASIYKVIPYGVLLPRTAADLQSAVELAHQHRVPLLPRTSGSSLAGQATNEAVVLDLTRHMNQVVELNVAEKWVRVQPGIVLDELNAYLRPYNLQFGPDPASSNRAAMGGIVSNNSTGSHSILYGMTTDHVLGMNVILSDGTTAEFKGLTAVQLAQHQQKAGLEGQIYRQINSLVWDPTHQATIQKGTPRHWRRCGGYNLDRLLPEGVGGVSFNWPQDGLFNLAKLVSGGEGTLAVMSDITLNLVPLPAHTGVAIVHFNALFEALESVPTMLEAGPAAIELLDNLGLTMCRDVPEYARLLETFLEGQPNCILITEFYGESDAEVLAKIERFKAHVAAHVGKATAVVPALHPQLQNNVWKVRKVGLGLMMSVRSDFKPIPFIEDAAVPVQYLAEYVTRIERFCNDLGTEVAYYAHASAGCIHIRPLINTKIAADVAKLPQIAQFSVELLGQYGGSLSSEHGDGKARSWLNEKFFGAELYGLYKEVKRAFDPHNLLNPGNIVDAPPMTENLRYGANYQTIPIQTVLDFSHDGGFDRAIEMCNGAGVCRKRTIDTMCPSFMATENERDSTRGRANMLRAALSGELPFSDFTSPAMYEAMDLCVSCKACKAECPSAVDMAKIKTEWLHHYHEAHGTPLRSKLFAHIESLSKLASGPLAPVVNWGGRLGWVQQGLARWVGIGGRRPLPQFARQPFTRWFARHTRPRKTLTADIRPTVVLFNDTFNTYNQPQVAIAATELLEMAGFNVLLPGVTDTGRPALSKGLLELAKRKAEAVVNALAPLAEAGLPIVFLEPSEFSAVTDDYLALLPHEARLRGLIAHCHSFEQFMVRLAERRELRLQFDDQPRHILLHGHCHQKALLGTGPSHKLLALLPNTTVTEVDSGCCGMAGSFGYETEHYEMSQKMGERRLFPAVRGATAATLVVAAGVSCREQIAHGTPRTALHPAEVLRAAVEGVKSER